MIEEKNVKLFNETINGIFEMSRQIIGMTDNSARDILIYMAKVNGSDEDNGYALIPMDYDMTEYEISSAMEEYAGNHIKIYNRSELNDLQEDGTISGIELMDFYEFIGYYRKGEFSMLWEKLCMLVLLGIKEDEAVMTMTTYHYSDYYGIFEPYNDYPKPIQDLLIKKLLDDGWIEKFYESADTHMKFYKAIRFGRIYYDLEDDNLYPEKLNPGEDASIKLKFKQGDGLLVTVANSTEESYADTYCSYSGIFKNIDKHWFLMTLLRERHMGEA